MQLLTHNSAFLQALETLEASCLCVFLPGSLYPDWCLLLPVTRLPWVSSVCVPARLCSLYQGSQDVPCLPARVLISVPCPCRMCFPGSGLITCVLNLTLVCICTPELCLLGRSLESSLSAAVQLSHIQSIIQWYIKMSQTCCKSFKVDALIMK